MGLADSLLASNAVTTTITLVGAVAVIASVGLMTFGVVRAIHAWTHRTPADADPNWRRIGVSGVIFLLALSLMVCSSIVLKIYT